MASVRAQGPAGRVGEIVLTDDGSSSVQPWRCSTAWRPQARGAATHHPARTQAAGDWGGARNRAVAVTSAPLLAFLDGDDAWAPDKLARQLAVMERGPRHRARLYRL